MFPDEDEDNFATIHGNGATPTPAWRQNPAGARNRTNISTLTSLEGYAIGSPRFVTNTDYILIDNMPSEGTPEEISLEIMEILKFLGLKIYCPPGFKEKW